VLNSAALLKNGGIQFLQSKMLLPTYDVFDEQRNFAPARKQEVLKFGERQLALTICEDAWNDQRFWHKRLYNIDPVEELVHGGADLILNISASPFHLGKIKIREQMLAAIAQHHRMPVILVNQVGGNDSVIFDGSSMVLSPQGEIVARARSFAEDLVLFDLEAMRGDMHEQPERREEQALAALVLGTRDYVHKCGFKKAVIGLSGGIDSAMVAVIAVEALGKENVTGIGMPSAYSSPGSLDDARQLASNLGIRFEVLPISTLFDDLRRSLKPVFDGRPEDLTEENMQSRIRGNLLMAFANKFNCLVLTTGNKSELAAM